MATDYILESVSLIILGACWLLCIQGFLRTLIVLNCKNSPIFWNCVLGIACGIIDAMLVCASTIWDGDSRLYSILSAPTWILMIQCATWAYCIRIKSIGEYTTYDKYVVYIPWTILLVQIPAYTLFIYSQFYPETEYIQVYVRFALTVLTTIFEVFLYVVLLKKVQFILEYRQVTKKAIVKEMNLSLFIVILLDFALMVALFYGIGRLLRSFSYIFRIVVIIEFYDELLLGLSREAIPFNSNSPVGEIENSYESVRS